MYCIHMHTHILHIYIYTYTKNIYIYIYLFIYLYVHTSRTLNYSFTCIVWGSWRHVQSQGFVNITHLPWCSGGPNSGANQKFSRICFRPTCCVQMVLQGWHCLGLYKSDPHSLRGQRPTSVRLPLAPLGLMRLQWHLWQLQNSGTSSTHTHTKVSDVIRLHKILSMSCLELRAAICWSLVFLPVLVLDMRLPSAVCHTCSKKNVTAFRCFDCDRGCHD